jgi:hypothetical protein
MKKTTLLQASSLTRRDVTSFLHWAIASPGNQWWNPDTSNFEMADSSSK